MHQYLYCLNEPIDRIDPAGNFSFMSTKIEGIKAGYSVYIASIETMCLGMDMDNSKLFELGMLMSKNTFFVMMYGMATGLNRDIIMHILPNHPMQWAFRLTSKFGTLTPKEYIDIAKGMALQEMGTSLSSSELDAFNAEVGTWSDELNRVMSWGKIAIAIVNTAGYYFPP